MAARHGIFTAAIEPDGGVCSRALDACTSRWVDSSRSLLPNTHAALTYGQWFVTAEAPWVSVVRQGVCRFSDGSVCPGRSDRAGNRSHGGSPRSLWFVTRTIRITRLDGGMCNFSQLDSRLKSATSRRSMPREHVWVGGLARLRPASTDALLPVLIASQPIHGSFRNSRPTTAICG